MPNNFDARLESELIIGIVAGVGTENDEVIKVLTECLNRAGYKIVPVKISSDVIPLFGPVPDHGQDKYKRISDLMDAGNAAREKSGDDSVLALGAATKIRALRKEAKTALTKTAVIVDSLKRPEEVDALRRIYPSGFILMGVHAEEKRRFKHLKDDLGMSEEQAKILIQRDIDEAGEPHGQRVNDTFHLADFFVRITDDMRCLRCDIQRIVDLWFGYPFGTPTFEEHAMFLAFSVALRSADLSRQVGAVVTRDSQILATGANECPCPGGGLYWATRQEDMRIADAPKGRDYTREDGDSNRAEQNKIIARIVQDGVEKHELDEGELRELLDSSRIRDLTEFGRVVHAEMEALLSCARNGLSTVGATLYCTTFPCHNCAKHIIAAGISRVVYVEPYPKSKTLDFHDDAIVTGEDPPPKNSKTVWFVPFVGVGPRRFFDVFSMRLGTTYEISRKHKDTGKKRDWSIEAAQLRLQMNPVSYLELEIQACGRFGDLQEKSAKEAKEAKK